MSRNAPRLVILYEDSWGPLQRFPLHDLVVKSAADRVPIAVHEAFQRVVKVPKKGVDKVLHEVARCDRFLARDTRVLVWVDNDQIRRHMQLVPGSARGDVIAAIKARAPSSAGGRPKPLEVFLLNDNLEDLLSSLRTRLDPAILARALAKRPDARDMLLDDIGRSPQLRQALRAAHHGFDCVSRFVGCVAAMEPWPVPLQTEE